MDWLEDVRRLEAERDEARQVQQDSERETLRDTTEWVQQEVVPAMHRFAAELRTIGRQVQVISTETLGRVEVRDERGLVPEFTAEVGTESSYSVEVRDRLPTMTAVFHGVNRLEVTGEQVYDMLKLSYLSKLKSGRG